MFDEEGHLVVSLVQEGLVRVKTRTTRRDEPEDAAHDHGLRRSVSRIFLVLMAVLVVFVLRFAVREGRRRRSVGDGPPLGRRR